MSQRINRGFNRDRFSTYITDSEVSRSDLARLADVSIAAIRAWEGGKREPDVERLARVCAVLRVEVTDVVNVPDDECMPSDLRIRCGLTQVQLGAAAGLSTTVVSGFERAQTRWSPRKAARIAPVLGVSVEQLYEAWLRARTRPAGAMA